MSDIIGEFNKVVLAWLLHKIKKKISHDLVGKQVDRFINNGTITLYLPGYDANAFNMHMGIHIGLQLLPFFIFSSNAYIVTICHP
jgi:hypothetical protein